MIDDTRETEMGHVDVTESEPITYTQIASCAVGDDTSELVRLSLRAKLESEREERKLRQQKSLFESLRSLFG